MKTKQKKKLINLSIAAGVIFIVALALFFARSWWEKLIFGDDEIQMHYFYSRTCPHCHAQALTHAWLQTRYPNLNIIPYETSFPSTQNALKMFAQKYPEQLDLKAFGTPTTIIGDTVNIGFSPQKTPDKFIQMIEKEQARIDASWDNTTMTRTINLQSQKPKK